MNIPEKWFLQKARNDYEAKVIAEFISPLNIKHNGCAWIVEDSYKYFSHIKNMEYSNGETEPLKGFVKISFDDFERYVLKKEKSYELW